MLVAVSVTGLGCATCQVAPPHRGPHVPEGHQPPWCCLSFLSPSGPPPRQGLAGRWPPTSPHSHSCSLHYGPATPLFLFPLSSSLNCRPSLVVRRFAVWGLSHTWVASNQCICEV